MKIRILSVLLVGTLLLGGCAGLSRHGANKSSLVEFLYPETDNAVVTPGIPNLELPLRVGVAFTPAQLQIDGGLSEAEMGELESFKLRVRDEPARFAVTTREGYTGSGSSEGIFLVLVVLGICLIRRVQK